MGVGGSIFMPKMDTFLLSAMAIVIEYQVEEERSSDGRIPLHSWVVH